VIVDAVRGDRMRTAAGGLADDRGPLEVFQVVGELLRPGEGALGGQHEDWLAAAELLAGHVGARPELFRLVLFSVVEIIQVSPFVE
jgi:hypothetical protein